MNNMKKVLVVSINAWRDDSGINTLINLFKHWDKSKLAQIYTRAELPNTKICDRFFQISETTLMRKALKPSLKCGAEVQNSQHKQSAFDSDNHISYKQKRFVWLLSWLRELIWIFIPYNKKAMQKFIDDFDPEVIFIPIYPVMYINRLQYKILKRSGKRAVAFVGDDNYSYKSGNGNPLFYIYRFFMRRYIRKIIAICDDVFVMVPKLQREYDKEFNIKSILLTKGMDYSVSTFVEKPLGNPIRIVYTGKMIYGRYKSLIEFVKVLKRVNANGVKAQLFIYSTDEITQELKEGLDVEGSSFLMGGVPMTEIPQILADADILVFVESLMYKYRYLARLSFSTKLTDYMYAGKCIFAVGDKDIAPIEYFVENDSALVATSYAEIESVVERIISNVELIPEYALKSYDCGMKNHNIVDVENIINKIINQ